MHAVRKQILEILKAQLNGATVAELAEQLEMAPVSVRHHLDILQGDNLICVDRLERKGNVGRPQQVYALTEEAYSHFPNNFAALAGRLVEQIKEMLPPDQVPCAFRAMAKEMAAEFTLLETANQNGDSSQRLSFEHKLEQITAFLNDRGYLASWEPAKLEDEEIEDGECNAEQSTFLLHKYNCPYAGVSAEHSELCLMDQTLINELTGCACERVESLTEGASCCTYRVGITLSNIEMSKTVTVDDLFLRAAPVSLGKDPVQEQDSLPQDDTRASAVEPEGRTRKRRQHVVIMN